MLRDTLFSNPQYVLSSCLVWIPVGIMVLTLIQAMVMGEIELWAGGLGLLAALGLGIVGMKPPHPSMSPLILLAATATLIMVPILRTAWNKREVTQLIIENVESAYESLLQKPDNVGARLKLAKSLYEQGMVGHAVAIGEAAMQGLDLKLFADDHRMVRLWRQHPKMAPPSPLRCMRCSHVCSVELVLCPNCGHPFLLEYARGWIRGSVFAKIAAAWIGAILVLIGVPAAATSLPPILAFILIPVLVGAAIVLLWRTFQGQVARA